MLAPSFAALPEAPAYEPRSPSNESTAVGKVRVLVVEEDILSRLARCQLLDRFGPFDARAADPAHAVAVAHSFQPQAVLFDLATLGVGGLATVAGLKQDAATRPIPVLALTGPETAAHEGSFRAAGVDDFLAKPLNLDELLLCLRHHENGPAMR